MKCKSNFKLNCYLFLSICIYLLRKIANILCYFYTREQSYKRAKIDNICQVTALN